MDKPIPEAVRDMPVADALDVVNAAANDARHAGDYAKANALVIARRTLYRAALIAAQQQQGQAVAFDFERARTLIDYVVGYARAAELKSLSSDACVVLRDLHTMLHAPQPTQQGGGDDLVEAEGEVYARKDVEPEILHEFRPFTAAPSAPVGAAEDMVLDAIERRESSAPVGAEGLARRIESYHWDVADKPVAAKFAAELRSLAQQPDADPLEEWANRPLNFTATVGKFEDGAVVQQPAAVDGAMVERIAALLYEEATDEPWTVAGVEHPGPDRDYYRGLASKVAAISAQQPAAGEEIMVNAAHDVYTLPLQPSGLLSGPRFVVHVPQPEALAKHQPCGCVLCTCEDEKQCQGCGAKHCGNRTDHPAYVKQQPAAVDGAAREYLAARDAYDAATRPPNSHASAPRLKHGDPIVLRLRAARVALDAALAAQQQEPKS